MRYIIDKNSISWIGKYTYGCSVWDGVRLSFRKSVNFKLPEDLYGYNDKHSNEFNCNLDELSIDDTINELFYNDNYTSGYSFKNGKIDFYDDDLYFYNSDIIDHIVEYELSIISDLIVKHNLIIQSKR